MNDTDAGVLIRLHLATAAAVRRDIERIVRAKQLNWHEFAVLRLLHNGPAKLHCAGAELGMSTPTLRNAVFVLATRELISRTHRDGRVVMLALTADGEGLLGQLIPQVQEKEADIVSTLEPPQRIALNEYLRGLVAQLCDQGAQASAPAAETGGAAISTDGLDPVVAHVVKRYVDDGATMRGIAAEFGRSYGWVRGALVRAGVELRGRGRPSRACRP